MILRRIGITDVIHPERQVAERMSISLMRRGMRDIFEVGGGLAVFEVEAPEKFVGYTLEDLKLRSRFKVNLITIKRPLGEGTKDEELEPEPIGIVSGKTIIEQGDQLVLVGTKEKVDKLLTLGE